MMRISVLLIAAFLAVLPTRAQSVSEKTADSAWKDLEFLIGQWTGSAGERDTPLGAGQGGFSFEPDLNRKIIVRRNTSAYSSGVRHEDLMVIYRDAPSDAPRAIYFDTEGHVIRYNLTFPAPNQVIFDSNGAESGPRYRLSYRMAGQVLHGKFEVAPPGAGYKTYMTWSAKKD